MTGSVIINLNEHIDNTYEPLRMELLEMCIKALNADEGRFFGVDLVMVGVANRAVSLTEGFFTLLRDRNLICAAPLVRMQLDCALRFYSLWLVSEPHDLAKRIQDGEEIRKIKDRSNQLMNDRYLVEKLAPTYPWITKLYKETSGFVHFTDKHIFSAFIKDAKDLEENQVSIAITGKGHFPDIAYFEAIEAFKASSSIILDLMRGWKKTKEIKPVVSKR